MTIGPLTRYSQVSLEEVRQKSTHHETTTYMVWDTTREPTNVNKIVMFVLFSQKRIK